MGKKYKFKIIKKTQKGKIKKSTSGEKHKFKFIKKTQNGKLYSIFHKSKVYH